MAEWVKCLLCKHESPSVDSQYPCRKPGKEDLSNLALVEWRQRDKDTS